MSLTATQALATHRLVLGGVALLAPRLAGRLFGLDFDQQPQAAVLTRLMASRNLVLGAGTLMTQGSAARAVARLNAAVDAVDLASVTAETRRRSIPRTATIVGGLTAGSGAYLSSRVLRRSAFDV